MIEYKKLINNKLSFGTNPAAVDMVNAVADFPSINLKGSKVFTLDFTVPTTDVYYFGFNAYSPANLWNLFVDDISVKLAPTCIEPPSSTVNITSYTTATAIWSKPVVVPANGCEYYVSPSATAPDETTTPTGATLTGLDTTALLAGLSSNTNYNFWVRSVCGAGDVSEWLAVTKFYTGICTPMSYINNHFVNSVTTTGGIVNIDNQNTGKTGAGFEDYYAIDSVSFFKGDFRNRYNNLFR